MKAMLLPALAPLIIAGCTTIDQAPLVYVSANTFGISAASGTADTPGAKLVIGYHGIDAAYVPVQVGRRCTAADPGCLGTGLTLIEGVSDSNDAAASALVRTHAKLLEEAQDEASGRMIALEGAHQAMTDALASQGGDPPDAAAIASARVGLDAAQSEYHKAAERLVARRRAFSDASEGRAQATGFKHDALSVYGSFDGKAGADVADGRPNASLGLGKAFSTGVAAQILTEGLGRAAASRAAANCLLAAKQITKTDADLTSAIAACRSAP